MFFLLIIIFQDLSKTAKQEGFFTTIWGKIFNNGSSKICQRQPLKYLKGSNILNSVFHFFYLVHS